MSAVRGAGLSLFFYLPGASLFLFPPPYCVWCQLLPPFSFAAASPVQPVPPLASLGGCRVECHPGGSLLNRMREAGSAAASLAAHDHRSKVGPTVRPRGLAQRGCRWQSRSAVTAAVKILERSAVTAAVSPWESQRAFVTAIHGTHH